MPPKPSPSLNLAVQEGEVFGYLGPNGAGKTTTIRVLLGLVRPTSGRASIFGLDSQRQTVDAHRRLAYVPGETNFGRRSPEAKPSTFLAGSKDASIRFTATP